MAKYKLLDNESIGFQSSSLYYKYKLWVIQGNIFLTNQAIVFVKTNTMFGLIGMLIDRGLTKRALVRIELKNILEIGRIKFGLNDSVLYIKDINENEFKFSIYYFNKYNWVDLVLKEIKITLSKDSVQKDENIFIVK